MAARAVTAARGAPAAPPTPVAATTPSPAASGGAGAVLSPVAAGAGAIGGKSVNVKVAIRIRPFNRREKELGAKTVLEVDATGKQIAITDPAAARAADATKKFTFDHVYPWE